MKMNEESEKVGLKLNIQKTKIMPSGPITSWQIMGKQWKQWQTLYFFLPPFKDNGLLFWVPDVLFQHLEVVLWNLLSV